ncbi:MAG: hypothetical protein DRN08_01415 [Thermoplasmata archaeon]|nr:MAG: hypothetical protein DRN08_01415 [Thermoplasmata archaeon]
MKVTCPRCKRRLRVRRGVDVVCKCGEKLEYMRFFRDIMEYVVYLIDANILIYATSRDDLHRRYCRMVMRFDSPYIKIGTTDVIIREVNRNKRIRIPGTIRIYHVDRLSDEIKSLKTNYLKQPSEADLSLVQAALNHAEIQGIITYDKDFGRIATRGLIQRKSSTKFWLGNAKQFLEKYEVKQKIT